VKVLGERAEDLVDDALFLPLLQAAVAGGVWRVAPRQIRPRRSSTQNPQDSVKNVPRVTPWVALPSGAKNRTRF
jgi:hypothetical protein